jgi:Fe2+ or Zn2+ uptake regulation protein
VLDAVRSGHQKPGQIGDATKYSDRQVYNLLGVLMEAGFVRHVVPDGGKLGYYVPVEQAA